MVLDSSSLLSIYYNADDAELMSEKIDAADRLLMSAATVVEVVSAVLRKSGRESAAKLERMIRAFQVEIIPLDEIQSVIAREAYGRYGRGLGHPAKLNLGDCFSYALAMRLEEPLLFKGNDFAQTDVMKA